ncbi:NAD(P)H-dependent oxidoreductase [Nocardia otitidiscaviarum]|uniref:NAD(P)H-dependent oxidoreductase n=1 Tax=Nocardia otitidiscaviarum TaxID=1823 RepID=A0A516NKQ3_9NOCA|nr:NAD(P)H-dependent oxidoreductase [Nocardia otitidiscaviarum]MCP9623593.1 NAD(P)H-dependent oxidoreductase [Nocardia otitidiscaviarum]QDP79482.1 NAD(P)H-dependent oxidoreductase [Nocardia otitidiscaviarum]
MTALTATALVCTLKKSPADSSSDLIARQILDALTTHEVKGQVLRVADYDVLPGVSADEGDGDEWPRLRAEIAASDILVVATPTWVGHMSSIAQRVLERLDAALSETDEAGRPAMTGKVAVAAVVGNEDGAHKIVADLFQGLNDIGFTIPSQGCTYWNDQAMGGTDYKDLDQVPEAVAATTATVARNAAHLARVLTERNYPAPR